MQNEKTNLLGVAISERVDLPDKETMLKAAAVVMRYATDPMDAVDILEMLFAPYTQHSPTPRTHR